MAFAWFVKHLPQDILDTVYVYSSVFKSLREYDETQFDIFMMFESSDIPFGRVKQVLPRIHSTLFRCETRWKILYEIYMFHERKLIKYEENERNKELPETEHN